MNLIEDHACGAIMSWERQRRAFVLPRYTPIDWWECDVFELTDAGYFREYEVKLTRRDFDLDANKTREIYKGYGEPREVLNKHECLARGDVRGPKEFFFVTPPGLVAVIDLPIWAGLIELHDRGEGYRPTNRWIPSVIVPAPRLHNQKADPKIHKAALGTCYWRMHNALTALRDRTAPPTVWQDEPPPVVETAV